MPSGPELEGRREPPPRSKSGPGARAVGDLFFAAVYTFWAVARLRRIGTPQDGWDVATTVVLLLIAAAFGWRARREWRAWRRLRGSSQQ